MVAFERFLARLVTAQREPGYLLPERARTTQDIDLLLRQSLPVRDVHRVLVAGVLRDLGDWFTFEVARPEQPADLRFPVQSLLDGRLFEAFHVDAGIGDPLIEAADLLAPPLLAFAGIAPVTIPAYPLSQQIAEKVHALTRLYISGESSRVRDWVDILLMAHWGGLRAGTLRQALQATFAKRGTHPLPQRMPSPPASWSLPFRRLCEQTGLEYPSLAAATQALQRFLDPLLSGECGEVWNPIRWEWE